MDELKQLEQQFPNFHYTACVSGSDNTNHHHCHGRASSVALTNHPNLSGWQVFLCGNADMVKETKRKAFLAKASMRDIFVDAF